MAELIIILVSLSLGSFANNIISFYSSNSNYSGKSDYSGTSKLDISRSVCFCGKRRLKVYELIPVLSYIFLKGKCSKCRLSISIRYLIVELLFALSGIISYMKFGPSAAFILNFITFDILIIIGVIDYYKYIIPNALVLALLIVTSFRIILIKDNLLLNTSVSAATALVLAAVNFLLGKLKGKDALGAGDIKLLLVLMILTEAPLSLFSLWVSAAIAIPGFYLMKFSLNRFRYEEKVPFGMFISIGFILGRLLDENIYSLLFSLSLGN